MWCCNIRRTHLRHLSLLHLFNKISYSCWRIYIYQHAVINRAVLASVSRGWFCSWSVYSQYFPGTWWQSSVLSCVISTCLGLLLGMSLLTSQKGRAAMSSLSCCCCQGGRRCIAFFCFTAAKCRHRNCGTSGMYWINSMCVYLRTMVDTQNEGLPWEAAVHKKALELDILRKSCCNVGSGYNTIIGSLSTLPRGKTFSVKVTTGLVLSNILVLNNKLTWSCSVAGLSCPSVRTLVICRCS